LRNRVFHHEPIWYWRDLAQQHAQLLETINWINPAMRSLIGVLDRFPGVHAATATLCEKPIADLAAEGP
jgi:hypothetical protein